MSNRQINDGMLPVGLDVFNLTKSVQHYTSQL